MVHRLPVPGSDNGTWGTLLNEFLSVSLDGDGNLLSSALKTAGGVTSVNDLAPNAAGSVTTTLAAESDVSITSPTNNQVLTYNSTSSKWVNQNSGSGASLDNTASDIQPLGVQAAGTSGFAADAKHVHAMPRLDQASSPTASVSLNNQKITGLANGTLASDAAAFGQLPSTTAPLALSKGGTGVNAASDAALLADLGAAPVAGATFSGYVAPAAVSLTFGSSIAVDASRGNVFNLTLTASTGTIANPTNPLDGQIIRFVISQDGTGSRTVAWGSAYDFGTTGVPTLSTGASKVDMIGFGYVASLTKWCLMGSGLGY